MRARLSTKIIRAVVFSAAFTLVSLGLLAVAIEQAGFPPRSYAPYIERRGEGHNAVIVAVTQWISRALIAADRGSYSSFHLPPLSLGAQSNVPLRKASAREWIAASPDGAIKALAAAQPGDTILFAPGTYRFTKSVTTGQSGNETNRITVRALQPHKARIEFDATEGFVITRPYWTFEDLDIRGTCERHTSCEHAFHVVGAGEHFVARNNILTDFNSHIKVNGHRGSFPDHGLIEGNTLTNTSERNTLTPVTPIDIVAASHWTIRRNVITDFVKGQGDRISYGAFVKGGGSANRIEQNLVLCEAKLKGHRGQRIGLSLGGGGTGKQYCRDGQCITEQDRSFIRSNLIAFCSDDGIYLNRAATSRVDHNTLLDTGGIVVRFAESSADVEGNLIDGAVRGRDGALVRASNNYETSLLMLFLGWHPVRALFANPETMHLSWKTDPPRIEQAQEVLDLCVTSRAKPPTYGAFEEFAVCLRQSSARTSSDYK